MKKYIIPAFCGIATGILNGLFGAGGGVIAIVFLEKFLGYKKHNAHASSIAIILCVSIITSFLYIKNGIYNIPLTIQTSVGGIIGGIIGAKLLNKISERYLHLIFGVFMAIAGIRIIMG